MGSSREMVDVELGMRAELAPAGVGQAIAALAARQFGVVSRAQLMALGLSRGAIGRLVAAGRLHLLHRGVYAVGHTALPRKARYFAAVLATGPGSVLSHRSAADLEGLRPDNRRTVDVISPTRSRRSQPRQLTNRPSEVAATLLALLA